MSLSADCGAVCVEDTDLTLLAANVLENAIRSAEDYQRQTGRAPSIAVIVGIVNNYLMMQVVNSCLSVRYAPWVSDAEKSRFLPVDAYESIHEGGGRGLKRVQIIVDKYQGRANYQFDAEKSQWTTRVSLMLRKVAV